MRLGVFSVAGGALNFGARRLETAVRVGWLPLALLFVVEIVTVFAIFSLNAGRLYTFADLPSSGSFVAASERALAFAAGQASLWSPTYLGVLIGSYLAQLMVASAILAPLIRLAALDERPGPGVARASFGPDEGRFVVASLASLWAPLFVLVAPIGAAYAFVMGRIDDAFDNTYIAFEEGGSLHGYQLLGARETLAARGDLWPYDYGLIYVVAGVAFALLLALLFQSFLAGPERRDTSLGRRIFGVIALSVVAALTVGAIAQLTGGFGDGFLSRDAATAALGASVFALFVYAGVRLFAYPAFAVADRSLSPVGALRLTAGVNGFALLGAAALVVTVLAVAKSVIDFLVSWLLGAALSVAYAASDVLSRLENSGVRDEGLDPLFSNVWLALTVSYEALWTLFTLGVSAGLYGRLRRAAAIAAEEAIASDPNAAETDGSGADADQTTIPADASPVWRRAEDAAFGEGDRDFAGATIVRSPEDVAAPRANPMRLWPGGASC
ncbi:MAG: hypothetical protein ACFB00_08835 [Parvularculaceae bacterium]